MASVPGLAHNRDDLIHRRRVGWVALALVARGYPGTRSWRGRRRAAAAGRRRAMRRSAGGCRGIGITVPNHSGLGGWTGWQACRRDDAWVLMTRDHGVRALLHEVGIPSVDVVADVELAAAGDRCGPVRVLPLL